MNEIVKNLTIENYLNLKSSFENSKKIFWDEEKERLVHPGEYGTYRENLIKRWLKMYIPKKFEISSGFLINQGNKISSQCDIIIYDRDSTPQIQSTDKQLFFPIETVAMVGEIKSDINSSQELNRHLKKLSEIKKLREGVKYPTPYFKFNNDKFNLSVEPYDNVFTFLICNKLNFDLSKNIIDHDVEPKHKHNAILSLNDALIGYTVNKGSALTIPFRGDTAFNDTLFFDDGEELPSFVGIFLCSIYAALISTTLLEIDMAFYLSNNVNEAES